MRLLLRTILAAILVLATSAFAQPQSGADCKNHYILSTCFPPATIEYLAGIAALAAGDGHTCALAKAGDAMCWGSNARGQLGDGSTVDRPLPATIPQLQGWVASIAAGGQHTCALEGVDGWVYCWGANDYGQLGYANTFVPVLEMLLPGDPLSLGAASSRLTLGRLLWLDCTLSPLARGGRR